MKSRIYSILLALLVCISLQAYSLDDLKENIAKAEAFYVDTNYDNALELYSQILNAGYESDDLYYNIANCYYRKGEIGPAILNYELALKLNPYHEDAKHNLELAESKTVDKIDKLGRIFLVDWWYSIVGIASADTWAWISVCLFIITLVSLAVYIFTPILWQKKLGFSLAVIALFFTIISFGCSYTRYSLENADNEAIVFSQTVTIKSSPDNSGNDLFILHEGTKVNIKSKLASWVEIVTSDGNSGWIPFSSIEIISLRNGSY